MDFLQSYHREPSIRTEHPSHRAPDAECDLFDSAARSLIRLLTIALLALLLAGCSVMTQERELVHPEASRLLNPEAKYLKVHMRAGDIYILHDWAVPPAGATVEGFGRHLDWNRDLIDSGQFVLSIDSVAIFETNVPRTSSAIAALSIVTVASLAITIVCIADPKACFGSCPTFYVDDGDSLLLQAEGFSSSVAPALERTDIDALWRAQFSSPQARLVMTNEAYETHVVKSVNLLAAPRSDSTRIIATAAGEFYPVLETTNPQWFGTCCDYSAMVTAIDGREWFTLADSTDLATKDTVNVEFERPLSGELGLIIGCRQTLLTTFLFYKTLAFMGEDVADYFARLQRQGKESIAKFRGFGEALSDIEVWLPDTSGGWYRVDAFRETGPLAVDVHLVRLGKHDASVKKLQLRMTRGCWRVDLAQLARLGDQVPVERIKPSAIKFGNGQGDSVLAALLVNNEPIMSMPGDTFELFFDLPPSPPQYEYWLESRGYYLEWMREDWKAERNPEMAMMILMQPEQAMRVLAPQYKRIESEMEAYFWKSRYAGSAN